MKLFLPSAGLMLALAEEGTIADPPKGVRSANFEIFSLLEHVIPDLEDSIPANGLKNYGCAGVGNMDATEKNLGRPIDAVDVALNNRKRCITCASSEIGGGYAAYNFDKVNNECSDGVGTARRAFCECDLQFANALNNKKNQWDSGNKNLDSSDCTPGTGGSPLCCQASNGLFNRYNSDNMECCDGNVVDIGSCLGL